MSEKQFSVVRFEADDTVEFVPSKWIEREAEDVYVGFPRKKTSTTVELQKNNSSLPKISWPKWKVDVVKTYDSVDRAESKALRYLITSDDSEAGRNTRQSLSAQPVTLPPPPPVPLFGNGLPKSVLCLNPVSADSVTEEPLSAASVDTEGQGQPLIITCGNEGAIAELKEEHRKFQEKVLVNQELMKAELSEIKRLLLNVLQQGSTSEIPTGFDFLSLIPLKTEEDLNRLDEELKTPANKAKLVTALCRFGRISFSQTIRDIMNYILDQEFSKVLRFTSQSGKLAFGNRKITEAIKEAVVKNHPTAKERDLNEKIAAWLRGSADRGGGRRKRNGDTTESSEATGQPGSGGGTEENTNTD